MTPLHTGTCDVCECGPVHLEEHDEQLLCVTCMTSALLADHRRVEAHAFALRIAKGVQGVMRV